MARGASGRPVARDPVAFTTDGLGAESAARWEEFTSSTFLPLHAKVLGDERLDATGTVAEVGSLRVMSLRMGSHIVEMSGKFVSDDGVPATLITITLKGHTFLFTDGQTHFATVDRLLVTSLERPFVSGFGEDTEALAVVVPTPLLHRSLGVPIGVTPRVIDIGNNFAGAALRTRLIAATRDPATESLAEDDLVELISAVLSPRAEPAVHNHFDRARDFIAANLSDTGLTAPHVARAVGISERHLSRIFADAHTSVPKYVREQRLLRSRGMLLQADDGLTVAQIAVRCGFGSVGNFSRTYHARFGHRPDDILRDNARRRALRGER
ncbi:helix-turn-helix domain-containing protein [Gordonia sputi]